MRIFLRFAKNALRYKGQVAVSIFAIVALNAFQFAQIGSIVPFIDKVLTNKETKLPPSVYKFCPKQVTDQLDEVLKRINAISPKKLLAGLAVFLFISIVLKSAFTYIQSVTMESVAQNVMRDFMNQMYGHLQELPVQYYAKSRTGELISRITSDVHLVQASLSAHFTENLAQTVQLPFLVVGMLVLNWKQSLIAAIFLPLLMGPIIIIGQRIRKLSRKSQEKIADIISLLQETITGVRIVRAFNMEKYEAGRFRHQSDRYYTLRMKSVRREALVHPLTEIVGVLCIMFVAFLLIMPVLDGKATFGLVAAYCGMLLISIKPLRSIGKVNNIIQRAIGALERIYRQLDTEAAIKEIPGAVELPLLQHEIKLDHVTFAYEADSTPVVRDLNLTVRAGEMIAIVGPSGAGKTTLANLIPRFYDVTEGSILFDGVDIRNATFTSLRSQIGIVTQETVLFNDTVRNNIAYGRADIPIEQVEEAAKAANAHQFILEMPQGYDTMIGERGVRLSGGQRQRLAIARAILKNPRILILDEATSSLDTESERLVQEAIDRLIQSRTVFAIAHRLSTIQHADRILVIHNGEVVQIGTHDALIADEDGLYKKLHDMQFRDTRHSMPTGFIDFIKFKFNQAREKMGTKPKA